MFSYFWNVNGGKVLKKSAIRLMPNEKTLRVCPSEGCKQTLQKKSVLFTDCV